MLSLAESIRHLKITVSDANVQQLKQWHNKTELDKDHKRYEKHVVEVESDKRERWGDREAQEEEEEEEDALVPGLLTGIKLYGH